MRWLGSIDLDYVMGDACNSSYDSIAQAGGEHMRSYVAAMFFEIYKQSDFLCIIFTNKLINTNCMVI